MRWKMKKVLEKHLPIFQTQCDPPSTPNTQSHLISSHNPHPPILRSALGLGIQYSTVLHIRSSSSRLNAAGEIGSFPCPAPPREIYLPCPAPSQESQPGGIAPWWWCVGVVADQSILTERGVWVGGGGEGRVGIVEDGTGIRG